MHYRTDGVSWFRWLICPGLQYRHFHRESSSGSSIATSDRSSSIESSSSILPPDLLPSDLPAKHSRIITCNVSFSSIWPLYSTSSMQQTGFIYWTSQNIFCKDSNIDAPTESSALRRLLQQSCSGSYNILIRKFQFLFSFSLFCGKRWDTIWKFIASSTQSSRLHGTAGATPLAYLVRSTYHERVGMWAAFSQVP